MIGGGKLANEEAYLLSKFARLSLKTNNIDHRVDGQIVASVGAFTGRQTDLSAADAILHRRRRSGRDRPGHGPADPPDGRPQGGEDRR